MNIKEEIIKLLESTKRENIEKLIAWLSESDYFTAPASAKYHGNHVGGLAEHSLNVYDSIDLLNKEYIDDKEKRYSSETLAIVALLHDVCKVNMYIKDFEPATESQLKYLWDLITKSNTTTNLKKEDITKAYAAKLIDYYKNGGEYPELSLSWKIKDELPLGHSEKSIYLIQKHIQLTDVEAIAIRWHMGMTEINTHFNKNSAYNQAVNECPLTSLLYMSDYLATWFVDKRPK
jgi:hypothetical protein